MVTTMMKIRTDKEVEENQNKIAKQHDQIMGEINHYPSNLDKEKTLADIQEQEQLLANESLSHTNSVLKSKISKYLGHCPDLHKDNLVKIGNVDFHIIYDWDMKTRTLGPMLHANVIAKNTKFIAWISGKSHCKVSFCVDSFDTFKWVIKTYG